MRRLIFICLFSFVYLAPITQNTASIVAENFFYYKNDERNSSFIINNIESHQNNDEVIFYVINLDPEGFIIISSDNLILPVLGFSFENNYVSEGMPTNIKYLFNLYSNQLIEQRNLNRSDEYIDNEWEKYLNPIDYEGQQRGVSPLISARFDQGTSWNDMCPEDSDGPGGNALVGCVAVSMAQIMHYWSYPEIGYGSHSYNHPQYGYQFADFGNSYYDYSDMPNNYPSEESQKLLYHCGVAVNMGYGADGSGANVFGSNPSTYFSMRNYFLYKNDMDQVEPNDYSTSQFRNLLQNELNNNRPIIYVGYSDDGGHAWNIDGYDDDYFHNNWGWGGSQNGYFLLSSLNGFDYSQGALINIEPESLDNPNVMLQSYNYEESSGDGDSVVNPGEIIELYTTVENLIPWNDSENIDMILSTEDPDLNIINDYVSLSNLDAGDSYTNTNQPFIVEFSENINFSSHQLKLIILSFSSNGSFDENEFYIDVDVSLNQNGFPYMLTLVNETGESYTAATSIQSSPLLIDIDNDGYSEIFFGDDNGFFHGVDYLGNPLNGFPIELLGTNNEIWGSPAADDIDNDGEIEIVVTSKNKHCYIIDEYGNIELDYETEQYLMATPSIANLDNDNNLEVIFFGYTTSGDVFAINHDGSDVNNFPVQINEKILKGGAIYDLNNNGKDDIIIATENDKAIFIIYDDGTFENIFQSTQKFKSAPSILDNNGNILILVGDDGGMFYGISPNGNLDFSIASGDNIRSSAGFIEYNNEIAIFFGSEDGRLYGIDINGNNLNGWPQTIIGGISGNTTINSSPIFADLNNDGDFEVITASEEGQLIIYHLNGEEYNDFPKQFDYGFISSPSIIDLDNDNDLEIIIGTNQNLSVIDLKETSFTSENIWSTYRGDINRTGSYSTLNDYLLGDLNNDILINVQDLVVLINIIVGTIEPNSIQIDSGDLNFDGIINVLDVVILVNIILE